MVLPVVNDGTFPFFGYSIKMTCLKKHHGKVPGIPFYLCSSEVMEHTRWGIWR